MVYKIADKVKIIEEDGKIIFETDWFGKVERSEVTGAGVDIVKLIDGERDLDQILEACIRIFGPSVPVYTLAKDIEMFIGELLEAAIITLVKSPYSNTVRN